MPEEIKLAFQRVKEDISYLGEEMQSLRLELEDLRTELHLIHSFIEDLKSNILKNQEIREISPTDRQTDTPTDIPTHPSNTQTIQQIIPTHFSIPTDNLPLESLKSQFSPSSIGNRGVPTDRQTDQQTDQQIFQHIQNEEKKPSNAFRDASKLLEGLDTIKKELRLKFKRLTSQEMAVFSLLYSLEETGEIIDYKTLASKLALSESSIRDYILKISSKGIPIAKEKLNNKKIVLHIAQELKKIASLDTIIKLREI